LSNKIFFFLAIGSINLIRQLSIHHLVVKHRLTDEKEIITLDHQFPNVKYLKLFFPLKRRKISSLFQDSFQSWWYHWNGHIRFGMMKDFIIGLLQISFNFILCSFFGFNLIYLPLILHVLLDLFVYIHRIIS